jgi:hypothetical protein
MTSAVDERGAADSFCRMTLEHTLRLTAPRSSSPRSGFPFSPRAAAAILRAEGISLN